MNTPPPITKPSKGQVKAVIFDLDGTLVSSSLDFALMRKEVGCPPSEDILVYIDSLDPEEQEKARKTVYRHEMADAQAVTILPGVVSLINELSRLNFRTGIVTRNSREATNLKLGQVGIEVEKILTRECAPAKPDPGALLQLCEQWQIKANEAIYVGDYLYDLIAADNADMHSCLYVRGDEPEYSNRAGFICQDYAQFLIQLEAYLSEV